MEFLLILIGLFLIIFAIVIYISDLKSQTIINNNYLELKKYDKKSFMTQLEHKFYNDIKELEIEYKIVPQINLAAIIKKNNKGYFNELFRNIDFAIFDKDFNNILLLIELNDITHNTKKRKDRDSKVREICRDANIELITFYSKYPNKKEYFLNRINEKLSEVKIKNKIEKSS